MVRNIDKEFQINTEFLDSIDFTPYFEWISVLSTLMEAVEIAYRNKEMPPELEREVFNYYSEEDFKDYLQKRYSNIYFYPIEDYLIDYRKGE